MRLNSAKPFQTLANFSVNYFHIIFCISQTFASSLPVHLRCFTPEWVYTKMCYLGVEVLQKKKQYEEAVGQLELLLKQDTYCAECRGLWWERLALNVHQHLKQPAKVTKLLWESRVVHSPFTFKLGVLGFGLNFFHHM